MQGLSFKSFAHI